MNPSAADDASSGPEAEEAPDTIKLSSRESKRLEDSSQSAAVIPAVLTGVGRPRHGPGVGPKRRRVQRTVFGHNSP